MHYLHHRFGFSSLKSASVLSRTFQPGGEEFQEGSFQNPDLTSRWGSFGSRCAVGEGAATFFQLTHFPRDKFSMAFFIGHIIKRHNSKEKDLTQRKFKAVNLNYPEQIDLKDLFIKIPFFCCHCCHCLMKNLKGLRSREDSSSDYFKTYIDLN